ncbi:MAG: hypothetical protein IT209_01535 [Armatimonadetes bacterium]|nr:hypothetical protein [Armatimonadota bacterium]
MPAVNPRLDGILAAVFSQSTAVMGALAISAFRLPVVLGALVGQQGFSEIVMRLLQR